MANYDWMTPEWIVQARAAEAATAPILAPGKLWDDKKWVYENVVQGGRTRAAWPLIPRTTHRGDEVPFGGQPAIRVFISITDGPEKHDAPLGAAIRISLSGILAGEAGLTGDDELLVVPWKHWRWLTGVRVFESSVIDGLQRKIFEHRLDHKDVEEEWGSFNWIVPMNSKERALYYSVLPTIGVFPLVDPEKGSPDLFESLRIASGDNPDESTTWWTVREIFRRGISSWGEYAPGHNGSAEIRSIKLRRVNFLRDNADTFVEEEFQRMLRRGELERSSIFKAISNGLFKHLSDDQRKAREAKWLKEADQKALERGVLRLIRAFRSFGTGDAARLISGGYGIGWAANTQNEANRLIELAWLCSRGNFLAKVGRLRFIREDWGGVVSAEAEKAYLAGEISSRELAVDTSLDRPTEFDADKEVVAHMLQEFGDELEYLTSDEYPN